MNYKKPLTYLLAGYLAFSPLQNSYSSEVQSSKLSAEKQAQSLDKIILADARTNRKPAYERKISEKKEKNFWGKYKWWIVGGTAIAGGVAAYFLTRPKGKKTPEPAPEENTTPTTTVTNPDSHDSDQPDF